MNALPGTDAALSRVLQEIIDLPEDFHEAGVMSGAVLKAIAGYASELEILKSAETGCGKSTLLLSWISSDHTVFTLSHYGDIPCESYHRVKDSRLLNPGGIQFELGPSQVTLPAHSFDEPLQLVIIDGPHGFPFPQMEYYHFYPNIQEGGILVVDDINIPTVRWLHDFLVEDEMFDLLDVVEYTSFFRRTSSTTFNPIGDDWWLQNYNRSKILPEKSHSRYMAQSIRRYWRRLLGKGVRHRS